MRRKIDLVHLLRYALLCGSWLLVSRPLLASANLSGEAIHYMTKAMAAYNREDYGEAKIEMQLALEREPNFAEAYQLKGMLLSRDGKIEEAQAAFKKALELNPRLPEDLRKNLEKQAHEAEANLTQEDFSHFHLQFHGAGERNQAWQAVKSLDEAYNYLGSCFGVFPPDKVTVIIFSSQEFWEAWNAPFWLGGFFDKRDGRVRVRMDSVPGGDEEMQRRLRHEFTHAFIAQLYSKDLPLWFQEGVAQYYAYASSTDSFWKDKRMEELRKSLKGAPWLNMARIQEVIAKKNVAPGYIYLAYLESEALALKIAKERGDSWVPSMIEQLRSGKTFDQAFLQVTGITSAAAMDSLQKSLQ
jgi:tetratricopeptide (TPR) repeat protein